LNPNTDIIISPLSIDMALTVLSIGSSGMTYKQMQTALKYPSNYSANLIQSNGNLLVKGIGKAGGVSMGEIFKFFFVLFYGSSCFQMVDVGSSQSEQILT
jgi:hypothetical protein